MKLKNITIERGLKMFGACFIPKKYKGNNRAWKYEYEHASKRNIVEFIQLVDKDFVYPCYNVDCYICGSLSPKDLRTAKQIRKMYPWSKIRPLIETALDAVIIS